MASMRQVSMGKEREMRKRTIRFIWAAYLGALLAMWGSQQAKAEIQLCGAEFTVTGFLRYEMGIHTAEQNPNNVAQEDNNRLNLSRAFFQTEWTYTPTDVFRLYSNVRMTSDQTQSWDSDLEDYDAFPVDVPDHDWTMLQVSEDEWRAEVWELWANIAASDKLWLRVGKQQVVWGEMIGGRILDAANPLDRSWNWLFEPEEFENIRIPLWMIRGNYDIGPVLGLQDVSLEAYLNPGDVVHDIYPEPNAPYNTFTFPPFFRIKEDDNRGKMEYGFRLGSMINDLYFTLNYIHKYNDEFNFEFERLVPDPTGVPLLAPQGDMTRYAMIVKAENEPLDLYGASANYAWGDPWNLVATFEGAWIPNQPYAKAGSRFPDIRDQGTFNYAIRFDRPTQVLSPTFLHSTMAMIQLQFTQTIVEGDEDKILGGANSEIDKTIDVITVSFRQGLWHDNYIVGFQYFYDTDGSYMAVPSFKYVYGDHWYFDIWGRILGGSEQRPKRFGSLDWADTVYGRITYQF